MGGTGGSSGTSSTYLEQFVFPVVGGERLRRRAQPRAGHADRFAALRASFDWQSTSATRSSLRAATLTVERQ